ncbi:MAG: sigma-70 family RNA polymerase sigma factor [Dehalococcoidia bacterium]|nr:sigma-70 family RNA polymerase sigma factor [Dehalococcoidia bacterium]
MITYEDDLIQQSKEGDLDAFNQLVETYQGQVYNLALRMLGTPQDAEDVSQEAFVLAWKAIRNFRGENFRAWLFRIASNACTDLLRSKRSRKAESLDDIFPESNPLPSPGDSPEDCVLQEELSEFIARTLLYLSEDQRLVVTLADLQDFSYEEIAQITHTSLGTVKSRLSRGRANLRDLLLERRELLPPEIRL